MKSLVIINFLKVIASIYLIFTVYYGTFNITKWFTVITPGQIWICKTERFEGERVDTFIVDSLSRRNFVYGKQKSWYLPATSNKWTNVVLPRKSLILTYTRIK